MKQGYWANYHTGVIVEIDEHESWMRRGQNACNFGVSPAVIAEFSRFAPQIDRDALLRYLFQHAPEMRIRGHGVTVTFEFASSDWESPLTLVRQWCNANAGPLLYLRVVNFATMEWIGCHWQDFDDNNAVRHLLVLP